MVRMDDATQATLDQKRGTLNRSEYIRHLINSAPPYTGGIVCDSKQARAAAAPTQVRTFFKTGKAKS